MRRARTNEEIESALRLRFSVFCEEQGVPIEAEQDGMDGDATHLLALEGDRLVGTCRLVIQGGVARLGRMAVLPDRRGAGIGGALLREADRAAREEHALRIRLHAQLPARAVYDRAGYRPRGEPFLEQGIEHVTMEKALA